MSLHGVEDLLAERGIIVSHEIIRFWVGKFGRQYAKSIRRDRPPVGDKWHLDEVVISIRGKKHWLWRAEVNDHGQTTLVWRGEACFGPGPGTPQPQRTE